MPRRFLQWLCPVAAVWTLVVAPRAVAQLRAPDCPKHAIGGRIPHLPAEAETLDLPPLPAGAPAATASPRATEEAEADGREGDEGEEADEDDGPSEGADEIEAAKAAEAKALEDEDRLRLERAKSLGDLGAGSPLRGRLLDAFAAPEPGESPREEEAIAQEIEQFATFDAGLAASRYDIPVELNQQVEQYLRLFQGPLREHFILWLARVTRYVPMMREILVREGLPADTVYLSLIESGFSPLAYSRARAAGQWQFIGATGRRFGLRSNFWVDERRDPEKATLAAARYLKELRSQLGSWYLAWAGYNAGAGRIARAVRRYHTSDFWQLIHGRALKAETKGYVPKLIAAALISKHPKAFGFDDVAWQPPFEFDEVEVPVPTDLAVVARAAGVDVGILHALNPALRRFCTPPSRDGAPYRLRVPVGSRPAVLAALAREPAGGALAFAYYKVPENETLAAASREFGVAPQVIARMNGLRRSVLPAGRELVIPIPPGQKATDPRVALVKDERDGPRRFRWRRGRRHWAAIGWVASDDGQDPWHGSAPLALAASPAVGRKLASPAPASSSARPVARPAAVAPAPPVEAPPPDAVRYTVAFGDTLWSISQRHGTPLDQLCRWNRIAQPSRHKLYPGERLWVSSVAVPASSAAPSTTAPISGSSYLVRDGDSLWSISRRLKVSLADLLRWNHLDEDSLLKPGLALSLSPSPR